MDLPPSLTEMLRYAIGVKVYCGPCNRGVFIPGAKALELFGQRATVLEIAARSRCNTCGAKAQDARPEFPNWQEELARRYESDTKKTARTENPRGE